VNGATRYVTHCTGLLVVHPDARKTYNENWKDVVLASDYDRMKAALTELHATVKGECPSLLNEDSGGSARLALEIDALLGDKP